MLRIAIFVLVCCAATGISLRQSFRSAEEAGQLEISLREVRSRQEALGRQLAAAESARAGLESQVGRLEQELGGALSWAQSLGEALSAEAERREQAAVASASRSSMVSNPPPFGVQRCIWSLRECLRADGYEGMQMLRASAVVSKEMQDVEFLSLDRSTGDSELVVARRMTLGLDRSARVVLLQFFDGHVQTSGVRREIQAEGHPIRLFGIEGRMWEEKLPQLVHAEGSYADPNAPADSVRGMDRQTREMWLECFDALLSEAGTELKLRVAGFVSLKEQEFRGARLVGYDSRNLLALSADCERLAVEVDKKARIVSLRIAEGTLRRDGAESTISKDGYRMLLPNITPERAGSVLLGMVVQR